MKVLRLEHLLLLVAAMLLAIDLTRGNLDLGLSGLRLLATLALCQSKQRRKCLTYRPSSSLIVVLCVAMCVARTAAEPVSIGTILSAIGTVISVISTIMTVLSIVVLVINFTITWSIAFLITVVIWINLFSAFGILNSNNWTKRFEAWLLQGTQCEPVDPEYGYYRPELYRNAANLK